MYGLLSGRKSLFRTFSSSKRAKEALHIAYRPDIDGMRALAVLAVVIFHFFPSLLPGGFTGVDIFFVLSGYLISSIIFSSLEKGKFRFLDFYARRVRRIFPTLIVVLFVTSFLGWISLLPSEFLSLQNLVRSTALFITNFTLLFEVGYFDGAAELKPLLHLWSLSVEEQFYILYPIFIFLFYRIKKRLLTPLLIAGIIISFAINIYFFTYKPEAVFYLLPGRAWELLVGGVIAVAERKENLQVVNKYMSGKPDKDSVQNFLSLIGLILVCLGLVYAEEASFPKWFALLPVIGTAFLILGKNAVLNSHVLAHPLSVFIGKISYSLYLWHWPFFSIARHYYPSGLPAIQSFYLILLSFILAIFTTYCLEKYLRQKGNRVALVLVGCMIVVFGLSKLLSEKMPLAPPLKSQPSLIKIDEAIQSWTYPDPLGGKFSMSNPLISAGKGRQKILFLGDSNMEQYWPRFKYLCEHSPQVNEAYHFIFGCKGGQLPILSRPKGQLGTRFFEKVENYIKDHDFHSIVLGAQWVGYLSDDRAEDYFQELEKTIINLKKKTPRIFLILNIPTQPEQNPMGMFTRYLSKDWSVHYQDFYDIGPWLKKSEKINGRLRDIANRNGIAIIDPVETLCQGRKCLNVDNAGYPIYKDSNHLTARYVEKEATFLDQIIPTFSR